MVQSLYLSFSPHPPSISEKRIKAKKNKRMFIIIKRMLIVNKKINQPALPNRIWPFCGTSQACAGKFAD
jgi:hypothetical protein